MSSSNCCFLTCIQVSQEAGQVVWYAHLFQNFPQFIVIRTVNKAETDVFLELSCFVDDPKNVGNLISGSSDFSKTSLNIWKFTVHILLKPRLENFEYFFATGEMSEFQHSLALPFFGIGMKTDLFQSCGHCWVFQICWYIECSTFTASSFKIWNTKLFKSQLIRVIYTQICQLLQDTYVSNVRKYNTNTHTSSHSPLLLHSPTWKHLR